MKIIRHIDVATAKHFIENDKEVSLRCAVSIDDDAAEIVSKYHGPLELDSLASISKEVAKSLGSYKGLYYIGLNGLKTISPQVAKELSRSSGSLYLNGIKELSPTAAYHLAKHKSSLYLYGLTKISHKVAICLAKHQGVIIDALHIGGLVRLSKITAEALSQSKGNLCLRALPKISIPVAKALAKHCGTLFLDDLYDMPVEIALAFSEHRSSLVIRHLETLSPAAAKALAMHQGDLTIHCRRCELSDASIQELAYHRGKGLSFSGLEKLSDRAAASLSKKRGYLNLDGLKSLSDLAAESLSKHKGHLKLSHKIKISETALDSLARHKGKINGFNPIHWVTDYRENANPSEIKRKSKLLDAKTAQLFLDDPESIDLSYFQHISSDAAYKLVGYSCLNLSGIEEINDEIAEALGGHKGELDLSGIEEVSDRAAMYLARNQSALYLDCLEAISEACAVVLGLKRGYWLGLAGLRSITPKKARLLSRFCGILDLSGLESLTPAAARELCRTQGELVLGDLEKLDWGAKQALCSYQGKLTIASELISEPDLKLLSSYKSQIEFTNLRALSKSCANALIGEETNLFLDSLDYLPIRELEKCISKHKGILSIRGITKISEDEALVLAKHKGQLNLSGLKKMDWKNAERLSHHQGRELQLNGLETICPRTAKALSKYPGTLSLCGLKQLPKAQTKYLAAHKGDLWLLSIEMTGIDDEVATLLSKKIGTIGGQNPSEWVKSALSFYERSKKGT
ncbi:MAG: hypothetical protein RLZZ505_980 [Verrucomicrobiota bacterium]